MTVKTMDVFVCDACKTTETNPEGCYEVPLEWFTIRMSKNTTASTADDLHICPSCGYTDLRDLWEVI